MGRVKLKIKRIENSASRQVTFTKRKTGILKKAEELSILCDIDIILLMFAPAGKPFLFCGKRSTLEQVIAKYAQVSPQERVKRKVEALETLKKTFDKLAHDVNIPYFLGSSSQTVEELSTHVRSLQTQLGEVNKRLSYWQNLEKIDNVEHLRQMEESLKESLNWIQSQKGNFGKCPLMSSLECSSEVINCLSDYQNDMHLPLVMGGGGGAIQESQALSWFNNQQQSILPDESSFLQQRDLRCSADTTSTPGFSGYFTTTPEMKLEGMDNVAGQVDPTTSTPGFSGYFPEIKLESKDNVAGQVDHNNSPSTFKECGGGGGNIINDMSGNGNCMSMGMGIKIEGHHLQQQQQQQQQPQQPQQQQHQHQQYPPYYSYSNLGGLLLDDEHSKKLVMGEAGMTAAGIDLQGMNNNNNNNYNFNSAALHLQEYHHYQQHQINSGGYDLSGLMMYSNDQPAWMPAAATTGPCNIPIFNENSYQQQPD